MSPEVAGPPCLGLTGGIGSGKSAALAAFRARGAATLGSDEVVHGLYADPQVVAAVTERFGSGVLTAAGAVDRGALADAAFADDGGVAFLEGLLHPRVGEARRAWQRAEAARNPPPPLLVCEVPLLFEVGLEEQFDAVLVVTAPEGLRRERVVARGQDFTARSGRQISEDEKLLRADAGYVNDGTLEDLEGWVQAVVERYARPAGTG